MRSTVYLLQRLFGYRSLGSDRSLTLSERLRVHRALPRSEITGMAYRGGNLLHGQTFYPPVLKASREQWWDLTDIERAAVTVRTLPKKGRMCILPTRRALRALSSHENE